MTIVNNRASQQKEKMSVTVCSRTSTKSNIFIEFGEVNEDSLIKF